MPVASFNFEFFNNFITIGNVTVSQKEKSFNPNFGLLIIYSINYFYIKLDNPNIYYIFRRKSSKKSC